MSGDIVERLRRLDDWLAGSGTAADELQEAADEIVRLRAERDASRLIISDLTAEAERLRAAGDTLVQLACLNPNIPSQEDWEAAIAAWEEACRG